MGYNWETEAAEIKDSASKAMSKMNARVHSTVKVEVKAYGKQLTFTTTEDRLDRLKALVYSRFNGEITKIEWKNGCKYSN